METPLQPEIDAYEPDFSPPPSLSLPLWRRLLMGVLERLSPERLPPLELTSRPVDVGMLLGERIAMPWFRTVFTNLGDVISPEVLPPLELESRPIEVGELLADQLAHNWYFSLLGNLRDKLAAAAQPPLHLSAKPAQVGDLSKWLQLPLWSSVIDSPKVYLPDPAREPGTASPVAPRAPAVPLKLAPPDPVLVAMERQLRRDLLRSRLREAFWISLFAAEAIFLVTGLLAK